MRAKTVVASCRCDPTEMDFFVVRRDNCKVICVTAMSRAFFVKFLETFPENKRFFSATILLQKNYKSEKLQIRKVTKKCRFLCRVYCFRPIKWRSRKRTKLFCAFSETLTPPVAQFIGEVLALN